MADITRNFAIERLGDIISFFQCADHIPNIKEENKIKPETYAALKFAISDMKRVKELEATEDKCNEILSNLSENINTTMKDFFAKFEELEAENENLKRLIANQKEPVKRIYIPENATNGDMLKAMFPNLDASVSGDGDVIDVYNLGRYCQTFDMDWWNAPYKVDKEN